MGLNFICLDDIWLLKLVPAVAKLSFFHRDYVLELTYHIPAYKKHAAGCFISLCHFFSCVCTMWCSFFWFMRSSYEVGGRHMCFDHEYGVFVDSRGFLLLEPCQEARFVQLKNLF